MIHSILCPAFPTLNISRTIPVLFDWSIYYISSQYTDAAELMSGYGAAIILLGVCAILFLLAFFIKRQLAGPAGPEPGRFYV